MLVLRRKAGESIILNNVIKIVVLDVEAASGRVKIGIEAPPDVIIVRDELLRAQGTMPHIVRTPIEYADDE